MHLEARSLRKLRRDRNAVQELMLLCIEKETDPKRRDRTIVDCAQISIVHHRDPLPGSRIPEQQFRCKPHALTCIN